MVPLACCAAAGAALLWAVYDTVQRAELPTAPLGASLDVRDASAVAGAGAAAVDPAGLKALHLFGEIPAVPERATSEAPPPEPAAVEAEELPETKLALKLRGVLFDPQKQDTVAIINAQGRDAAYRVGEKLQGQADITEITPRHVVFRYKGKLERLSLEIPSIDEGGAGAAPGKASSVRQPVRRPLQRSRQSARPGAAG